MANDYTGRSVDLFVLGPLDDGVDAVEFDWLSEDGGYVVAGIEKAVQFFLLLFLTEKGSRFGDDDFGTSFPSVIGRSNINDSSLRSTFREAIEDILDQQSRFAAQDADPDELIESVDLLSVETPDRDSVYASVRLTTRAGDSRELLVPIKLAIR